jgi:RNA-dependent RNA polymerase
VRYQLEVCISHGRLSEFNMTRDFVIRLMSLGETKARRLLEHVATHKSNYLNPMEIFKIKVVKGATDSKIPEYCCFMRTARITPTTVYYNTPTVDTSNRITRRYIEFVDRFLRVRFSDEMYLGPVRASINGVEDEVYKRIKATLARGITIGGRHYEFLAFGNSQFREQGAYFFASVPNLSAAHIRAWMGQFSHIRNIAKHTSRLGQCFSTTRAVGTCVVQIKQIPDIERNGYVFSDGVGKISKFLAQMATNNLKIRTPNGEPPSAFQFRLGGCKGMLVVSSDPQPSELHIRPSQQKFESPHGGLEIIRWSSNSMATLNRQLILILAALGISMRVILEKQNAMLQSFNKAMTDDSQAVSLLQTFVDPNHTTLTLADLVHDGFRRVNEPFVISTLSLWKAWHFKYLKEKAKIVIEKGANLFGVLDETGLLQGWFDENVKRAEQPNAGIIDKIAALPEVFVQISPLEKSGQPKVIEGICILARNPSLHPGDIRVVRAVNEPKLRHLMDVIVFPQTGDRDLASMCSGGDLDGDDYLIMWDPDLIPDKWFTKPMADNNEVAPELDRDVTVDDMTSFFVTYMKNNCLPRIASAHMAWADRLDLGVQEQKCIRLASMHSAAVDYNKTGRATKMTWNLEPKQWPHFMGKKRSTYHSTKVLGRLYDAVETIHFVPDLSVPFDSRILECDLVPASESFMVFATRLKKEYDAAMLRIMAQFEIKTEFEVWSTFVLNHSRVFREFKLHEDLGHIASTLRNGFRQQCFNHVGGRGLEDIAPLVVAMYRVTHEAKTEVLERLCEGPTHYDDDHLRDDGSETGSTGENAELPLISFPWIFHEYLGKVATGQFKKDKLETCKDQQSFGKIFTHAEVQKVLVEVEQEGDQAIAHGEDDKIRTEMTNAAFEKMLATIDVQSSETDEIEVKEVLVETPDNLSNLGTVDSGIGLSFSTERLPDDDVPLMTFEEDEDEGDRTDGVETIIQEIVETESSIPQSMLKQLLSLVGA